MGLLVALAVIGHDFSVMPLLGALVGTLLPVPEDVFPYVLGFFAGLFLYAAS